MGGYFMLTWVQKEILQSLINLYRKSEGKSIKGEEIAVMMSRKSWYNKESNAVS